MSATGTRTITVMFPLPRVLLSINAMSGMHWARKATIVRQQRVAVGWAAKLQTSANNHPVFPAGRVRVNMTVFPRKGQHRPDDTALWEAAKPWLDGLEDAGIVANDKQFVVGALTWASERKGEVELVLTELDAAPALH